MKFPLIGLFSLLFLFSCGGDDNGSSSGGTTTTNTTVTTSPPVTGTLFFWDENENSVPDPGEPVSTETDEIGFGTFSVEIPEGSTVEQMYPGLSGGIPSPTGFSVVIDSNNPDPDSVVISPLTTLISLSPELQDDPTILLNLINSSSSTYYDFELKDLYTNSLNFRDESLLVASLAIMNSLWENFPDLQKDTPIATPSINPNSPFYKDFKENTEIFNQVLKNYSSDRKLAVKMGATFSSYIHKFTNDALIENFAPTQLLLDAIAEASSTMGNNTSLFSPVVLIKNGNTIKAEMLNTAKWLPTGDYYSIGLKTLNAYQRSLNKTIGDFNSPPFEIELDFKFIENYENAGFETKSLNLDTENFLESFEGAFDEDNYTYKFTQGLTNKNGKKPKNESISKKLALPIYVKNWSSKEIIRRFPLDASIREATETYFTVLGEGLETRNFYGIDTNVNIPNMPDFWKTNYSRTNNCAENKINGLKPPLTLDYNCQKKTENLGGGNYYIKYKALPEKATISSIKTFIPSETLGEVGRNPPKIITLKIMPPKCYSSPPIYDSSPGCPSPGDPTSQPSFIELKIVGFELGELDFLPKGSHGGEFRTTVGSIGREAVKNGSSGLIIGIDDCMTPSGGCYNNNLLIHSINTVELGGVQYILTSKSGFFRNGILFLDLRDKSSNYDFIMLNLATRSGFAFPISGNRTLNSHEVDIFHYNGIANVTVVNISW